MYVLNTELKHKVHIEKEWMKRHKCFDWLLWKMERFNKRYNSDVLLSDYFFWGGGKSRSQGKSEHGRKGNLWKKTRIQIE